MSTYGDSCATWLSMVSNSAWALSERTVILHLKGRGWLRRGHLVSYSCAVRETSINLPDQGA